MKYVQFQEDGMKKLLPWFLNLVMQLEAIQQAGAEPYQRNEERTAHRNGYKKRSLKTHVGEISLDKPQFREISFKSCVFDKYSRVERALVNAIAESYLQGVSTRRVQDISQELDEKVDEFLKSPIEHPIPYLYVDASYFKVRDGA
ncbi:MAG: transposase, partial [Methanothrix sp.]|nr:transposase [Methanothrix sp.]